MPAKKKAAKKKVPLATKQAAMAKARKVQHSNLMKKLERAFRLHVQGMSLRQAAFRAGIGSTLNSAGSSIHVHMQQPEVQQLLADIRADIESDDLLTLYKIRQMRKQIAEDPAQFAKDRLSAMAAECKTMGWDRQPDEDTKAPVEVHVHIGAPVDPAH
jgi:hypothetical protein